jgi:hypothetical protein
MDNGLLFPYRFYGGKGGTRKGRLSVPIGHGTFLIKGDVGAGKSAPDTVAENGGKPRRNPKRLNCPHAAEKILVIVEVRAPVPQTDSGR